MDRARTERLRFRSTPRHWSWTARKALTSTASLPTHRAASGPPGRGPRRSEAEPVRHVYRRPLQLEPEVRCLAAVVWPRLLRLRDDRQRMSRFDLSRFSMEAFRPSPRQADLMIVPARLHGRWRPRSRRIYQQMAEPKWVISMGVCATSGGPYYVPTASFPESTTSFRWTFTCPVVRPVPMRCCTASCNFTTRSKGTRSGVRSRASNDHCP